ncbi:MAG: hypothetical protein HFF18_09910 [Oscillospiraceae bacterium]|nr:hypothetical protein [Oscillospiraceae bacterium]
MKGRLLCLFGVGGILVLTAWAVLFFRRWPYAASAAGGALLLAGLLAFVLYRLAVWRFPWFVAEKRLVKFLKRDKTAWILYGSTCENADCNDDGTDSEEVPELSFLLELERREGLKVLTFSGEVHWEDKSKLCELEPGAELTAVFTTGTKALYFTGRARLLEAEPARKDCRIQLSVHRARLSNRRKSFPIL